MCLLTTKAFLGTESPHSEFWIAPLALLQEVLYFSCRSERGHVTASHIDLPQGTLDLLILRTLALGRQHGWAISERVQQMSSDALRIQQGSLYPALHRLERRGLIKAHWGTSENNRRAKYYELSKNGRQIGRSSCRERV